MRTLSNQQKLALDYGRAKRSINCLQKRYEKLNNFHNEFLLTSRFMFSRFKTTAILNAPNFAELHAACDTSYRLLKRITLN